MRISPPSGSIQPDDVLEQNAFAAAARPHDDKNFAGVDLEIDAFEHFGWPWKLLRKSRTSTDTLGDAWAGGVHFWT